MTDLIAGPVRLDDPAPDEGTDSVQSLIVGRAITGIGAFV